MLYSGSQEFPDLHIMTDDNIVLIVISLSCTLAA